MTSAGWFMAGLGFGVALSGVFLIVMDVLYATAGRPTLSQMMCAVGQRYPLCAAILGAVLGLTVGAFLGHVFFPLRQQP